MAAKSKTEKNDEIVLALLAKVKIEKEAIQKLGRPAWLTTCTIGFSEAVNDRINIQTVTDPVKLTDYYTRLLSKEALWKTATEQLGLDVPAVHQASSIADWKKDFQTRAAQLGIEKRKRDLETLEKRIDGLVTVEQRRELEIAAIQAELG